MINLDKEIKENEVLVFVCGKKYNTTLIEVIKDIEKQFKKICFITINKPYNHLIGIFKENNINPDKFGFIDAITNTVTKPPKAKNCVFVRAPNALTELNIAIKKVCKNYDVSIFILDSLSSLLIYEKEITLIKFMHSVINFLKMSKTKAIFIILEGDSKSALMKDLAMFVDKVIRNDLEVKK